MRVGGVRTSVIRRGEGSDERDLAAGLGAVKEEVAVGRDDGGVSVLVGEVDKAGVSEVHGDVAVFVEEGVHRLNFIKQAKVDSQDSGFAEIGKAVLTVR